jgi:hypothetical protein
MAQRIAMVTWHGLLDLANDDRLAAALLRSRGSEVAALAWDDPDADWSRFDAIVLRSCWDYHLRPAEFGAWIDRIEEAGARLWNPPALARWNAHKGYLLDLAAAGCAVVPTALLPRGDPSDLGALLADRGWSRAVLKPAIAASAFGARRIGPDDAGDDDLAPWRSEHDLLVQPFLDEIAEAGEWSLIFMGGTFSHAVHKRPGHGDFRVQYELGGSMETSVPPGPALAAAHRVLEAVPGPWLYARVDGVVTAGGFLLMELEMLEPSLFLDREVGAPARLADAIERVARG